MIKKCIYEFNQRGFCKSDNNTILLKKTKDKPLLSFHPADYQHKAHEILSEVPN